MNTIIRKTALTLAVLVLGLALVLAAVALVLGPALNASATRRLAEKAVRCLTGFSCRIEGIHFEYPFELTVSGISLEGRAGENAFHLFAGPARIASSPKALLRGNVDEIRVDGVELDVRVSLEGTARSEGHLEGRPFEIPPWVWRIGTAHIRVSEIRLASRHESVCLEGPALAWARSAETREGRVNISLSGRPGQPEDVVFLLTPQSATVLSGPAVLPDLALSPLIAFAGLDVPVTGTFGGAAFPAPGGPHGAEALYLELFSDDLALDAERFNAGFVRGSLRVGGLLFLPQQGTGLAAFLEELTASAEGLALGGKPVGSSLEPIDLSGSVWFDTLSDVADWTVNIQDRRETLRVRVEGTLAGILARRHQATASVLAVFKDLGDLAAALSAWSPLPDGASIKGGARATARLAGDIEALAVKGSLTSSRLEVASGPNLRIPVRLDASFSGALREGSLAELRVATNRFELGPIASAKASLSHGPAGSTATINIDSIDPQGLASLLGPLLPRDLSGYQWEGTAHLSATAQMAAGKDSPARGDFTATLRDGKFASGDYQRMGEGIDLDVKGVFRLPGPGSPVDLTVEAALPKGEIVIGEHYGNLARIRPHLEADLRLDPKGRTLRFRSAGLVLDGVGAVGLTGHFSQGRHGRVRANTRIDAGPIHLDELLDRVLRDGVGGLYPGAGRMSAAGVLTIRTDLALEDGAYRARGEISLQEALLDDPSKALSVKSIAIQLPFSLATTADPTAPGNPDDDPTQPGTLSAEGIDFRGIEIPKVQGEVLLSDNRLTLLRPMQVEFAGGSVDIPDLVLADLGSGREKGRAALEIHSLDVAPLARAVAGKAVEGRLSGRIDRLELDDRTWKAAGRLGLRVRGGELNVENIELLSPPSGLPSGRCSVTATGVPLKALSSEFIQPPLEGTLDGDLPTVAFSRGKLATQGSLTLSIFGGTVKVSKIAAGGLPGPNPYTKLDLDMKEIDLEALTAPRLEFGRVSGVLQGRIHGLRVRPGFPYATAFDADLQTVKRRGVTQKIDATAVETLSRIGGSSQLASALSGGLYRFFDEYYYGKMGIRAVLKDGWLELHGIPKGDREFLIVRALWVPTLSMPITVLTPNKKIRFNRWLADIMRLGEGR